MPRPHVWVALFCGLLCTLIACTAPQPDTRPSPGHDEPEQGASGIGDDYYPHDGNGGYDATGYDVSVRYDPATGTLDGDTTVTARATQTLSRFNLDLRGFTVSSVDVDGRAARFSREGTELVITPPQPVTSGSVFHTRVRYGGEPTKAEDAELGGNGWQRTPTGGAFALGEPHSASYWYPVNDHPRDKATFELTATVPQGWSVVSIGAAGNAATKNGWTTTTWTEPEPVASYLTTVAIDRFAVERGTLADGTPVLNAFAPGSGDIRDAAARTGEIIAFLESRFGAYPATSAGGIYLGQDVGYSLETQGRPTYGQAAGFSTVVHELAHQWYGNSVSVASWKDICLNECLASYSEWLWAEGKQGQNLDAKYRKKVNHNSDDDDFWQQKLYDPGAGREFQGVYDKGPLAMHALRRQIGDDAFNRVLREWPIAHENGNATWPQFEDFVQRVSGRDLRGFFDAWFHGTERPAEKYLYPGSLR